MTPRVDLDAMQLMAIQRLLRSEDIDVPDEVPDREDWVDDQLEQREFDDSSDESSTRSNSTLSSHEYDDEEKWKLPDSQSESVQCMDSTQSNPELQTRLQEQYPHDTDMDRALYQLANACPICGDTECDENVAWVGATPIHASRHPENQPRGRR